jgi:hypothetical protein
MPNLQRCDVVLLNDDQTPTEFVVVVLKRFFVMTRPEAQSQMLRIHHEGSAICGTYQRSPPGLGDLHPRDLHHPAIGDQCARVCGRKPRAHQINQRHNRSRLLICPVRPAGQKGYQGSARE